MEKLWTGCASANFRSGRRGQTPMAIVIHIMDGYLRGTDAWFNNPRSQVSAHYGVGKNGEVHQYVAETDTAFHAGTVDRPTWALMEPGANPGPNINPNYYTIGIEHEGFATDVWTPVQVSTSAALIAEVAARWGIRRDVDHVIKHHQIRASKPCPGDKIDIGAQLLGGVVPAKPPVPNGLVVLRDSNLRRATPSTAAPIVSVMSKGAAFNATDYTSAGERVAGNPFWYRDANGNCLWAGATNIPNPA